MSLTTDLPRLLTKLNPDERAELMSLVEKKAWVRATQVQEFSDEEKSLIAKEEKQRGPKKAKRLREHLYKKYHWDTLRWFLFGGYVDIPIQTDPKRAYDPVDNPWVKIRMPGWAYTTDEHDEANPYKLLPDKRYLRVMAYAWVHEPLLLIPKSRQMMVTWLFCCITAHETLFRNARNTAYISKKFDDANAHLQKRVAHVCNRLPSDRFFVPPYKLKSGELSCEWTGSIVRAMGEEAKGLRQYTFSWIFSDEMAFQEQADEMVTAAMPTVKGGGRFTGVSTPNGEEIFYELLSDRGRIPTPAGG